MMVARWIRSAWVANGPLYTLWLAVHLILLVYVLPVQRLLRQEISAQNFSIGFSVHQETLRPNERASTVIT
jgi:hypothetical protein